MRQLGIPTVVDRFVQQAILQVLEPILDPTFSASSFGFRRGRGAHQALAQANRYVSEGRDIVVDLDLEKFFDQVNHDILMSRLARRIDDKRLLHILRRFLEAGMMQDGVCVDRNEGTPQGGPLSPLLANLLLDDLDKELEQRGHCFCRYADDCNIYVESHAAGERVMASVTRFLEGRLRLRVNRHKSAVARVIERKFLGYRLLGNGRLGVSPASLERAKARIRILTRRNQGRRFADVIGKLNAFLVGWVQYFRHAQCRGHLIALDKWIRRRLRCYRLKQRKRRYGIATLLIGLRLSAHDAWRVAKSGMGWWPMSGDVRVQRTLSLHWFKNEGLLSLTERYDGLRLQ
jgi:RNA-directed DNA polymerase